MVGCGGSDTGERPASEAEAQKGFGSHLDPPASDLRLSRVDCAALAKELKGWIDRRVRVAADTSPPQSRCRFSGRYSEVSVYLDVAYAARQRYENRMTEQVQFNAPDPAKVPHHVRGVGDPSSGEHFASWIPAYSTLFAVRGNRWLTVAYSVTDESRPQRRQQATELARRAFRLTAN